jgi:hypothetical protein
MPGSAGGERWAPGAGAAGVPPAGVIWRRAPHEAVGSVPFTKAMGTTRTHSFEGSMSTETMTTRSGVGKSSLGLWPSARTM